MYYRHLYARCTPDLRQRCDSWKNYCELFGLLLQSKVNMQLPNQWLWDMIDEFIYQFQSFCQYRWEGQYICVSTVDGQYRYVQVCAGSCVRAASAQSPILGSMRAMSVSDVGLAVFPLVQHHTSRRIPQAQPPRLTLSVWAYFSSYGSRRITEIPTPRIGVALLTDERLHAPLLGHPIVVSCCTGRFHTSELPPSLSRAKP